MNENLKKLRKQHGYTQQEIANMLNISRMKYNHYELKDSEPNIETLKKIADIFHITVDSLIGHEVPYMLDKSSLSNEQIKLIDKIINLSREQCMMVDAYVEGYLSGEHKHQETLKKLKGKK